MEEARQVREFFEAIWGNDTGVAELRTIAVGGKVSNLFFDYPGELDTLLACVEEAVTENVFAGVLLRDMRSGTNEAVKRMTHVLWSDFDTKRFDDDRLKTFGALQRIDVPPQIIVDSGHGFHAYWLLDGRVGVVDAQRIMKGIARRYGGDTVGDPARVMRVPGSRNMKDDELRLVRMVRFNPLERTRIADVLDYAEPEQMQVTAFKVMLPSGSLAERFEDELPKGQRSELIFGIVCEAVRSGWGLEEVATALLTKPAGEKVQEMSSRNAMKWIERTYRAAVEAVNLEA